MNKPAFASVTHSTESDLQSALMSQKTEPSLEEHREMEKNTALVKEILEEVITVDKNKFMEEVYQKIFL